MILPSFPFKEKWREFIAQRINIIVSRLFVHEVFVREEKKACEHKGAEKEPKKGAKKRSRKEMGYFTKDERRFDDNAGQTYGRIRSYKKTSPENNKRSARGWIR